jgi:hypothetical protein
LHPPRHAALAFLFPLRRRACLAKAAAQEKLDDPSKMMIHQFRAPCKAGEDLAAARPILSGAGATLGGA